MCLSLRTRPYEMFVVGDPGIPRVVIGQNPSMIAPPLHTSVPVSGL